jgi:hypothetical protein
MMMIEQEFGILGNLRPSPVLPVFQINQLPMPYHGNKRKLIPAIDAALDLHDVQFQSVLDAFSGSAAISLFFKKTCTRVIANDLLESSWQYALAFVENSDTVLTADEVEMLVNCEDFEFVNCHWTETFYLGTEFRQAGQTCRFSKFTLKECRDLDRIRKNISVFLGDPYKRALAFAAVFAIVYRLPFGNMDQSVSVLKHRKRQEEEYSKTERRIGIYYDSEYNLRFEKWMKKYAADFAKYACDSTGRRCRALHGTLSRQSRTRKGGRCLFGPTLRGKNGRLSQPAPFLRGIHHGEDSGGCAAHRRGGGKFVNPETYQQHFEALLDACRSIPIWLLSYSSDSWKPIDEIESIVGGFGRDVITVPLDQNYSYKYRERSGKKKKTSEYLIIAR